MRTACRFRRLLPFVVLASLGLPTAASEPVNLLGSGSTFIYPILAKWCKEYQKLHPSVHISYDPVGSGRGVSRTLAGTVDFGASDGPLTDAQIQHAPRKIVHVPVVLGAVVPAYNLPGIARELRFTPAALAGIYLGTITRWDDPEIVRNNPGLHLPAHELAVLFRIDGSGTTYVWTDYLAKLSPEWNRRFGRGMSVRFPVGIGARFNEGVLDLVQKKPYSIGYLQITYAIEGHVQTGAVENSTGNFVRATSAGISAAAAATATTMPDDFRVSITNAADSDAYPIASFTWLLVPDHIEDKVKRQAIADFLRWVLTAGQEMAQPLHYARLPGDVAGRVMKAVDRIH